MMAHFRHGLSMLELSALTGVRYVQALSHASGHFEKKNCKTTTSNAPSEMSCAALHGTLVCVEWINERQKEEVLRAATCMDANTLGPINKQKIYFHTARDSASHMNSVAHQRSCMMFTEQHLFRQLPPLIISCISHQCRVQRALLVNVGPI